MGPEGTEEGEGNEGVLFDGIGLRPMLALSGSLTTALARAVTNLAVVMAFMAYTRTLRRPFGFSKRL